MNKAFVAFILGTAAGTLNVLFALAATLGGELPETADQILIYIIAGIVCALNLFGACICKTRRTAGGVIILSTALPLLAFMVLGITSESYAALFLFPETVTAAVIAELVSVTAAILCFAPVQNMQSDFYYEHGSVRPGVLSAPPEEDKQLGRLVQGLYKQPLTEADTERPDASGTET